MQYLLPKNTPKLVDRCKVKEIHSAYLVDLPHESAFFQEVERWRMKWSEEPSTQSVLSEPDSDFSEFEIVLQSATTEYYPNINTVLRVILTLPVSTATSERSFSCLRCFVKTKWTCSAPYPQRKRG